MNKVFNSKYVTIDAENANPSQPVLNQLMSKIEHVRGLLPPETLIDVSVDMSGDHLYHMRGDISLGSDESFIVHSQNNDLVAATDALVANIKNTFCKMVAKT